MKVIEVIIMYNYIFANIFLHCYERKIDFESLVKRISEKKEKEYLNGAPPFIKDMSYNQIWSLESELNILSEELRISTELLLFPRNYTQKVLNFLEEFDCDFECETVSFDPEDLSWNIWIPSYANKNSFFFSINKFLNVDNMKYEYHILVQMVGLCMSLMGAMMGNGLVIYDTEIGGHIEEIDRYIDKAIDKMDVVNAETGKPIINPGTILDFKNVIIKSSIHQCAKDNHDTCIRNALIYILDNTTYEIVPETVPLLYCKTCNIYYMYEDQYNTLSKKGKILCRIYNLKQWQEGYTSDDFFGKLNMESVFKICGYSVSSNSSIPDQARQNLLSFLIDRKIVSLAQTLNFLHWLIDNRKDSVRMQNAVKKWKSDLKYITEKYRDNKSGTITVESIIRK